ncbi:MAG: hypothetical protein Q9164_007979, partial [Protoblastenia rupestris]
MPSFLYRALTNRPGTPKVDLETYISNYKGEANLMVATPSYAERVTGRTRFERLFLIVNSSPMLCLEALKTARDEAKQGKDVGRYEKAARAYYEVNPEHPDSALDTQW